MLKKCDICSKHTEDFCWVSMKWNFSKYEKVLCRKCSERFYFELTKLERTMMVSK